MSLIDKINAETNAYIDTENLVEYLFTGWDRILTKDEKLKLIAKHPHKRRVPLGVIFENALVEVANNFPQTERKIIHRQEQIEP